MSILDILSDEKPSDSRSVVNGVIVGVITNNKDPEKLGRVKVKFLSREDQQNETDWIRIASSQAGPKRGNFFLPEVDDEVLLAFNEGNVHQPYVIGCLWSSVDKPPEVNEDGKNNIKLIKTRCGHEIIFNDKDGENTITIHTPKGLHIKYDDKAEVITLGDKGKSNMLEINSKSGEITLKADKKITIKTGGCKMIMDGTANSIKMESSTSLEIKSQQIKIEAGGMLNIKSGGMAEAAASGIMTIKGAMVKIN